MDRAVDRPRRGLSFLRTSFYAGLLIGALALTPFRPLKITGHSMEPTLRDGETYLLDQFYWKNGGIRRDDIVVVNHGEEKWVKRLVGMPGDKLQLVYAGPDMISRVDNLTVQPSLAVEGFPVRIRQLEPDEIFVIGDNLGRSSDSTNQEAGAFKIGDVIGVVRTFTLRRNFPYRTHL
jgi:signal peptidase I